MGLTYQQPWMSQEARRLFHQGHPPSPGTSTFTTTSPMALAGSDAMSVASGSSESSVTSASGLVGKCLGVEAEEIHPTWALVVVVCWGI